MYEDGNWSSMSDDARAKLLKQINPIDGKYSVPKTTTVWQRNLPFYERIVLVRISDPGWPVANLNIYYLSDGTDLYRLSGQSPPIHEINELAPVRLTEDNVLDYLRFFCWFVRAEDGPFVVLDQLPVLPDDIDANTREMVKRLFHPARCDGTDERGYFLCDACVCHAGNLFTTTIEVQPNGMVVMTDDEVIATGISVGDIEPIA